MSDVTNFVPEPTIDEMLEWVHSQEWRGNKPIREAIRAILEQHRHNEENAKRADLSAIRAFVERVEKRAMYVTPGAYRKHLQDELAAMSAEPDAS